MSVAWKRVRDFQDIKYEHFEGIAKITINRPEVRNFEPEGFNDRAESMRIEQGHWLVCSDAEFQGQCRTFGPGEYPSLPPGLDRSISSARIVDNR